MTQTEQDAQTEDNGLPHTDSAKKNRQLFVSFLVFVSLIGLLFLFSKRNWERKLRISEQAVDSLTALSSQLSQRMDSVSSISDGIVQSIIDNEFDSFDAGKYRIYGLYRDPTDKARREQLSNHFNIFNPGAIFFSDAMGERWFTIPVKGVHFVGEGETVEQIAIKYYGSAKSASLISDFNPTIEAGRHIFIPFNH